MHCNTNNIDSYLDGNFFQVWSLLTALEKIFNIKNILKICLKLILCLILDYVIHNN